MKRAILLSGKDAFLQGYPLSSNPHSPTQDFIAYLKWANEYNQEILQHNSIKTSQTAPRWSPTNSWFADNQPYYPPNG